MGACVALGAFFTLRGIRAIRRRQIDRAYRSGTYYFGRDAIALGSVSLLLGLATLAVVIYALVNSGW